MPNPTFHHDTQTASNVIPLHTHPAFLQRTVARQARQIGQRVSATRACLDYVHAELITFHANLERAHAKLEPTCADCTATLAALDSGSVPEMERVRDSIMARVAAK